MRSEPETISQKTTSVSRNSEYMLIAQSYAPPIPYPIHVTDGKESQPIQDQMGYYHYPREIDQFRMAQIALGTTTFIYEDQVTGYIKTVEVLGKDITPTAPSPDGKPDIFQQIIAAAATVGPQRFEVGDQEFLLGVVPKEEKLTVK